MNPNYNNNFCKVLGHYCWSGFNDRRRNSIPHYMTIQMWNSTIVTLINRLSAISNVNNGYSLDTMICSADMMPIISSISMFSETNVNNFGTFKLEHNLLYSGEISNRYKVYCDLSQVTFRKRNLILERKGMGIPNSFVLLFNKSNKAGYIISAIL